MKVAIISPTQPGCMAYSVRRGFQLAASDVECEIIPYPRWLGAFSPNRMRGAALVHRLRSVLVRTPSAADMVHRTHRFQPDLALFIKCDDLHPATYAIMRRLCRARIAAFHPDDPFNRGSFLRPGPGHRRSAAQMKAVDCYFIWSHKLVGAAREAGARRSRYLPFACDPELHPRHLGPIDPSLGSDVCFVGNWDIDRERWLSHVASLPLDLAIWGSEHWRTRCRDPKVRAAWRGRQLIGSELSHAVAASKININILRRQNLDACNMRTFEIPCSGGFMLHQRSTELSELFPPGEACEDYDNPDELVRKIRRYLDDDEERRRIAQAGYEHAMSRHTYTHWARRVISEVFG